MSSVTLRAEQALLGALLTQQQAEHTAAMRLLEANDFGQRLHRHVFTALHDLRTSDPTITGPALVDAIAERIGSEPDVIQSLADSAPTPAHADAYAQMVQTAAFRREIADASQSFAQSIADSTTTPATIETATGQTTNTITTEDPHRERLLAALERQVEIYSTLANTPDTLTAERQSTTPQRTETGPTADPSAVTPQSPESETATARIGGEQDAQGQGEGQRERARLEDLLLADLMRNPEQSDALATFLADSTFTSGQRREIYQTILTTAHAGQPIDDVIIAWQVELHRATTHLSQPHDPAPEPPTIPGYVPGAGPEPDLVYLTRLASTDSPRTAIEIGQRLVTDDMTTLLRDTPHPNNQTKPQAQPVTITRSAQRRTTATAPAHRPAPTALDPSLKPPAPVPSETQRPTPRTDR